MDRSAQIGLALLGGAALLGGGYWYLTRQPRNGGTILVFPRTGTTDAQAPGTITQGAAQQQTAPPTPASVRNPSASGGGGGQAASPAAAFQLGIQQLDNPVQTGQQASAYLDVRNAGTVPASVVITGETLLDGVRQGIWTQVSTQVMQPGERLIFRVLSAGAIAEAFGGRSLTAHFAIQGGLSVEGRFQVSTPPPVVAHSGSGPWRYM